MKKKTLFIAFNLVIALVMLLGLAVMIVSEPDYVIDGNKVYINTSLAYISAEPHHTEGSSDIIVEVISKQYEGDFDVVIGFNTTEARPKRAYFYNPKLLNVTHSYTCAPPLFYNYTTNPLHLYCWYNITTTDNATNQTTTETILIFEHDFETYNLSINTVYWTVEEFHEWQQIVSAISSLDYDYNGKNKWFYIKNIPITIGQTYTLKVFLDVEPCRIGQTNCDSKRKYDIAFKPSDLSIAEAISQGKFYLLDPTYNLTNGLVSYFSFDANANDNHTNKNDGTVTGATHDTTTKKLGAGSYAFDGSGSYITLANESQFDFDKGDAFSICFWAKTSAISVDRGIMGKVPDARFPGYSIWHNDGGVFYNFQRSALSPASSRGRYYNSDLGDNIWAYYCFVVDGTAATTGFHIYRNGSAIDDTDYSQGTLGSILNDESFKIGHARGLSDFNGNIDEVGIWSRNLSLAEHQQLYDSGDGCDYDCIIASGAGAGESNPNCTAPSSGTNWNLNFSWTCNLTNEVIDIGTGNLTSLPTDTGWLKLINTTITMNRLNLGRGCNVSIDEDSQIAQG